MRRDGNAIPFVLGTGLVTWVISERAFWGRVRPDDSVPDNLVTLAVYTAIAYLGLVVVRRLAVADARRLFLVGALVGLVVEGMIVATVYEALPLSISWTGLAWHAPLSVVVGWYLFPLLLARGGRRAVLAASTGGVALGAWSAFMSVDAGVAPDAVQAAATATVVAGALGLGYTLQARYRPGADALRGGAAAVVVAGLAVVWALLGVVPAVPFAPLILVPILAILLLALRRGADREPHDADPLSVVPGVAAPRRLAPLLLMPPAAILGCTAAHLSNTSLFVGYAVYAIATPGGVVALVLCARRRSTGAEGRASRRRQDARV